MSQTYKWGDPVWVETGAHGRCKGIIIGPNDDSFPLVSLMLDERVSQIDRANFPLRDISPRVVKPTPRTWRLPEKGDTVRVIEKAYKTFWQELEITKVLWGSAFPIHAGGGVYDILSIQLVRLHDDPTPADHVPDAEEKVEEPAFDPVTKARHYNLHPSGVECITIAKHMNFCLGSALKYILRVDNKGTPIQDLRKAIQFLEYEIERRQELEASRGT